MCDTFVVVKPGRVLFAKNSDRDPNEAQVLSWVPARDHPANARLDCTWTTIPQVPHTHAVILSRPFWMWGAEMGANEHGVVIGNEAIFTREPMQHEGLLGMDLVRLGLERARNAGQAKDLICELIERYGQGGRCGYDKPGFSYHNSFIVADAAGAWVVEAAGKSVATKRIEQGAYAISNGITLQALRSREDRIRPRVAMAAGRRQRVLCLAESVADVHDAMAVLRDHGEGNERPRYRRLNGAMSAPCMHAGGWLAASQTVGSFVAALGQSERRYWATGTAAPCLSLFRPVSVKQRRDVGTPTGRQDDSLWWTFETVHRAMLGADAGVLSDYLAVRDRVQAAMLGSDEAAAWQSADSWLRDQHERLAREIAGDDRPPWLRRYWQRVTRQASYASRFPWRPA
jgi:dipeptidase